MGPLATADLFRKIILMTRAGSDREHIRIIIDNNTNIPDRTEAILNNGDSPLPQMLKSARLLETAGADAIIMPCNTAHYFVSRLESEIGIPLLNMITATADKLAKCGIRTAGLLATDGTCQSGIYEGALTAKKIKMIRPDEPDQKVVMHAIYRVKAGGRVGAEELLPVAERLSEKGADGIILGCTELPLILNPVQMTVLCFDPTAILAEQAILFAGKELNEDTGFI